LSSFNYTIYQNENILDLFFRDAIQAFREVVETWEGYEIYLPKLDNLIRNIGEMGRKCYIANKNGCGFNVLNHGDLHSRNILIKANAERRIEHFYFVRIELPLMSAFSIDIFPFIFYLSPAHQHKGGFSNQRLVLSRH
jgi:Ecdysteroid kinase-like family